LLRLFLWREGGREEGREGLRKDCRKFTFKSSTRPLHFVPGRSVEPIKRLVEHQHAGGLTEGGGEQDLADLARGEHVNLLIPEKREGGKEEYDQK